VKLTKEGRDLFAVALLAEADIAMQTVLVRRADASEGDPSTASRERGRLSAKRASPCDCCKRHRHCFKDKNRVEEITAAAFLIAWEDESAVSRTVVAVSIVDGDRAQRDPEGLASRIAKAFRRVKGPAFGRRNGGVCGAARRAG
jgi:hypothetical protein